MQISADRLDVVAGERIHAVLVVSVSMVSLLSMGGIDRLRNELEDIGFRSVRLFVDRPARWLAAGSVTRPDAPEWLVFADLMPSQTASLQRDLSSDLRVADAWDARVDAAFELPAFHPYAVDLCGGSIRGRLADLRNRLRDGGLPMLTMQPFDWRRLTPLSAVEHRLDPGGTLLLRGADPDAVPFATVRVRDGRGGFVDKPIEALGFVWSRADDYDGWTLRTTGQPTTMAHTAGRWTWPVVNASSDLRVDERFLFVTIGCEVGNAAPDASGLVRAPRTEIGYPRRTGEADHGDRERDAEDWNAFVAGARRGIVHSSHGLMQTLISTAVGVRPDLFVGVDPAQYRDVLADPTNSIACGAAYAASFPEAVRRDPLAARFHYGAGSVRPSTHNRWGAVLFDELVPLLFVAFWNDLAAIHAGKDVPSPSPPLPELADQATWLFAAFSCFVLAVAASLAASMFIRRSS